MPKMKTHKSGAKRYKVSGTGKLMRAQAGRGHLNAKKTSRRKRALDHPVELHPSNVAKLQLQLPYLQYIR